MLSLRASFLVLLLMTLFVCGCGVLHHQQPLTWHLVVEIDNSVPDIEKTTLITKTILERRLNVIDVRDAIVRIADEKAGQIEIRLPEVADRERLKAFLIAGGKLELVHVLGPAYPNPIKMYADRESAELRPMEEHKAFRVLRVKEKDTDENKWVAVETPSIITNTDVRNASAIPAGDGFYHVSFNLRNDGAQRFSSWTQNNINEYLGVALNDDIKSIAFIRTKLFDSGVISGSFTKASAEDLAQILMSGAFPAAIRIVEESKD